MGTIYIDTGGATTNSGSSDNNAADLSGTADAVVTGSVVQLTVGTNLSGVVTAAGPTQSAIYIADATNANQKIFWITAKDDGLDQVTVSVAPTGVVASNWAIGGRMVHTPANIEAALRAGDIVQINNSPATRTTTFLTTRTAGDSAAGFIKFIGKTGVRPKLTVTNTAIVFTGANIFWWLENLELEQQGASGNVLQQNGAGSRTVNVKISDGGGAGITSNTHNVVVACEVSGVGGDGINHATASFQFCTGSYIHDVGGDGIELSAGNGAGFLTFNIIDTAAGRGILVSAANTNQGNAYLVQQNTVYGCGNSGFENNDADSIVTLIGNIFQDNGNAAGEFNVEWVAGTAEFIGSHAYNVFYQSGAGNNLSNLTANSTEAITDPGFTNAAGGDFSISSAGSAKATSYPGAFVGGTSTGYLDIGAVQRQEAGGSGSGPLIGGRLAR